MTSSFWEFMYLIIISFFLLAYLTVMFRIVVDLFRDESLGCFAKAIWIVALFAVPFLTALAYVVFRGRGMAERQHAEERQIVEAREAYIRQVSGSSPSDQIARARSLLTEGAITDAEYAQLKAQVLGNVSCHHPPGSMAA